MTIRESIAQKIAAAAEKDRAAAAEQAENVRQSQARDSYMNVVYALWEIFTRDKIFSDYILVPHNPNDLMDVPSAILSPNSFAFSVTEKKRLCSEDKETFIKLLIKRLCSVWNYSITYLDGKCNVYYAEGILTITMKPQRAGGSRPA